VAVFDVIICKDACGAASGTDNKYTNSEIATGTGKITEKCDLFGRLQELSESLYWYLSECDAF
jgi:hypothetical protein